MRDQIVALRNTALLRAGAISVGFPKIMRERLCLHWGGLSEILRIRQ